MHDAGIYVGGIMGRYGAMHLRMSTILDECRRVGLVAEATLANAD